MVRLGIACVFVVVHVAGARAQWVYWTDWNGQNISRAPVFGGFVEQVIDTGDAVPSAIAIDATGGKMYWVERTWASGLSVGTIKRANLDGSEPEELLADLGGAWGIALDLVSGHIYWSECPCHDGCDGRVRRASLDGSEIETVVADPAMGEPLSVAVDLASGKIYWSDARTRNIMRADLDGSGIEYLVHNADSLGFDFAIDATAGQMYWPGFEHNDYNTYNYIYRASSHGSNIERVVSMSDNSGGVAIDAATQKIYWIDSWPSWPWTRTIRRANLDGSGVQDVVAAGGALSIVLAVMPATCEQDGECRDTLLCNGDERCIDGFCRGGSYPCPGFSCDEDDGACFGGTCCQGDNACWDGRLAHECQGVWDVFADGVSCLDVSCPVYGPCCVDGGCLENLEEAACNAIPGAALGTPGRSCQSNVCDARACCFPNGDCVQLADVACARQGGSPSWGASCAVDACPVPAGACCFADSECRIVTYVDGGCVSQGGVFVGSGTTCDACATPPLGACCFGGACAPLQREIDCLGASGDWTAWGVDCHADTCPLCVDPDIDGDADVDVVDFARMFVCLGGDGTGECKCVDMDNDNDVDLRDCARFQLAFTGPG